MSPLNTSPQVHMDQMVAAQPNSSPARGLSPKPQNDPDLARVIDRWETLSESIRRAILALVDN